MNNKRKLQRRRLKTDILVALDGEINMEGTLLDLSESGMLLLGVEEIKNYRSFKIRILLPNPIQGKNELVLDGVSRWSKYDPETEKFMTGFELNIQSAKLIDSIHLMMERYCEI